MTLRQAGARLAKTRAAFHAASHGLRVEILKANMNGKGPGQIAEEAGVSRQHVHNILKGNR